MIFTGEAAFSAFASKRSPTLDVPDVMARDQRCIRSGSADVVRMNLVRIELHERGRIEVKNQSRVSLTISESVFSPGFNLIGLARPTRFFPTRPGRTHGWLRSRSIASSSADR